MGELQRPLPSRPWVRALAGAAALAALALVFLAYRDPHTVLDLASRVWACF
jgi:hypothetical protein